MQDRIGLQLTVWHVCSKHEAHPMRPLSFGLSQVVAMLDNRLSRTFAFHVLSSIKLQHVKCETR